MSTDAMRELAALCAQLREAQRETAAAEEALKKCEAAERRLSEEDIPALMSELGVEKLVLETGEQVTVGLEVYASITKEKAPAAHAWLEANGFGALIDTEVDIAFSREKRHEALAFADEMQLRGLTPEMIERVHASRLKAFIKERLEAGAEVPLELFGARPVKTAKLKAPRGARAA